MINRHQQTILVVEDSAINRVLIVTILHDAGYSVIEAEDGLQGLEICKQTLPDLILTDIAMPNMDGFELCAALQQDKKLSSVPVIILTTMHGSSSKTKAFALGAVDYVTKPYMKEEILARIKSHLKLSRLTRSLHESNKKLLQKQEILQNNLNAAAEVQNNLLPKVIPTCPGFHFATYFEPCQYVGGDIYNIFHLNDRELVIYVVDVSGHGASAAMMTALISQALSPNIYISNNHTANNGGDFLPQPSEIFKTLNEEFPIERFNLFFTIFYFQLNTINRCYCYSSAGHPPSILQKNNGSFLNLGKGGPMIGLGSLGPGWQQGEGQLEAGDRLFLFSDGISEYPNSKGDLYGIDRFQRSLAKERDKDLKTTVEQSIATMKGFGHNHRPPDDITLVALECD